jgi:hypothetical protein
MSYKAQMHGGGESSGGIVPAKQPNEDLGGSQEVVEGRPLAKENTVQSNSGRTQSRASEPSGLDRVREAASKDGKLRFTALLHHVTVPLLESSDYSLKRRAAAGVDGVTWEEYGKDLAGRLADLHGRIHRGAYQGRPSRRVWIPKPDGRQRPLGIAALEDKIVQHAVGRVLNQSPTLANLYLHYVLDVWVKAWRKKEARGDMIVVRYADDAVLGFQNREDADGFLGQLRERLRKFGLELHPDKTRLIEFGRYAADRRRQRGEGKPETFNFLGFTHICGTSNKTGFFVVKRKSIGKRMGAKLKDMQRGLHRQMHGEVGNTGKWLQSVVRGYFQYHAIPGNEQRLRSFRNDVLRLWLRQLRRRSQRSGWSWKRFLERLGTLLPIVEVQHPYPDVRFAAKYPRWEPCALGARARVCAGGAQ